MERKTIKAVAYRCQLETSGGKNEPQTEKRDNTKSRRHCSILCKEVKKSRLDKDCYSWSLCEQVEKAYMIDR